MEAWHVERPVGKKCEQRNTRQTTMFLTALSSGVEIDRALKLPRTERTVRQFLPLLSLCCRRPSIPPYYIHAKYSSSKERTTWADPPPPQIDPRSFQTFSVSHVIFPNKTDLYDILVAETGLVFHVFHMRENIVPRLRVKTPPCATAP